MSFVSLSASLPFGWKGVQQLLAWPQFIWKAFRTPLACLRSYWKVFWTRRSEKLQEPHERGQLEEAELSVGSPNGHSGLVCC